MFRKAMVLATVMSLSACSWVQLTQEGEKVRILSASEVTKCKSLGKTTASVQSKIGAAERRAEVVQDELNRAARNGAADMRGDTVVPLAPVKEGRQTFGVYRCMPE